MVELIKCLMAEKVTGVDPAVVLQFVIWSWLC